MTKIILVGYMASGKTTIAKLLSQKIKTETLDLDYLIENNEKLSIKEIFENKGELYFRKLENQFFREIISSDKKLILSLGGGTPCYYNNHELLLNENIISIYLKASIQTLCSRLILQKTDRPLVASKNEDDLKEFVAKQLFERSFYYHQAKIIINTDTKTPNEIVDEIMTHLSSRQSSLSV